MALENRNLEAGTRLVARYKKQEYTATVVEGEGGGLRYRLEDGREFKSPSAAGSAVMGGVACNGWRFWSLAGEGKAAAPKKERKAPAPKAAPKAKKPAPKTQGFQRLPNGEGAAEATAKFFCDACMEAFEAPVDSEPTTCPKGHQPDGSPAESAD
jgi:hypothetical protein